MSLAEIERALRLYLINQAHQSNTVTYTAVADALRPYSQVRLERPFSPLYGWLDKVSEFEVHAGRPMLSAIVVTQGHGEPGDGFYDCARRLRVPGAPGPFATDRAFWQQQLEAVWKMWAPWRVPLLQTHAITLADGRKLLAREYPDGAIRVAIDDPPYAITEAFLSKGKTNRAIIRLEPWWNWQRADEEEA